MALKAFGSESVEMGKAEVHRLAMEAWKKGYSAADRDRLAVHIIVKAKRSGKFLLCSLCRRLIYLTPSRSDQGATGLHPDCYWEWLRSEPVANWRRQGTTRVGRIRPAPMPMPHAGRGQHSPSSEHAQRALRFKSQTATRCACSAGCGATTRPRRCRCGTTILQPATVTSRN